jgi:hypothetical protein
LIANGSHATRCDCSELTNRVAKYHNVGVEKLSAVKRCKLQREFGGNGLPARDRRKKSATYATES